MNKSKIIVACGIIFIIIGWICYTWVEIKTWNNNICTECGMKDCYTFVTTSYNKGTQERYIYKCKKCGHLIEINTLH